MSKRFSPTHRMLIKAIDDHSYEMVEINIVTGLYRKCNIKMTETKIRVNKSILGEVFTSSGTKALGLDEIEGVANAFNEARITIGYEAMSFRLTEEIKK